MKQFKEIIDFFEQQEDKTQLVMAMVIETSGSSYRKKGARMLINKKGEYAGNISGGCLEEHLVKRAKEAIESKQIGHICYDTRLKNEIGYNMGCEGMIRVLIDPIHYHTSINTLKAVSTSREINTIKTVVTPETTGTSTSSSEEIPNLLPDVEVVYEKLVPNVRLLIVGAENDVIPLVNFSNELGWATYLCGPKDRYPPTLLERVRHVSPKNLSVEQVDSYTAVVFMSHCFTLDSQLMPVIADTSAFYIGSLGPEKRKLKLLNEINRIDLAEHIHGPIGLPIGTRSPEEIALAVCAEIQMSYSKIIESKMHQTITI